MKKRLQKKHHVLEIGTIMTRYKGWVKIRCTTVMRRCTQVLSNQNPETAKVNTSPHQPLTWFKISSICVEKDKIPDDTTERCVLLFLWRWHVSTSQQLREGGIHDGWGKLRKVQNRLFKKLTHMLPFWRRLRTPPTQKNK